jgi:hypothetical protein
MTEDELRHEFVRLEEGADGDLQVLVKVIDWPQTHTPSADWVVWKGVPAPAAGSDRESLAREALRDERYFGICKECGERNPRRWMHSAGLCQRCAGENHGVVY